MSNLLLVGKPNSGKSTLFNQLTGLNQKTGNFSGVTVALKIGQFGNYKVIDIPGLQSLITSSPEELISRNRVLESNPNTDKIIFIANGMQLMDSLLLFSQIADLQLPIIFAVNFIDEVNANQLMIKKSTLANRLACPVYFLNSKSGEGFDELKEAIDSNKFALPNSFCRSSYDDLVNQTNTYSNLLVNQTKFSDWEKDYNKRKQLVNSILTDTIEGKEGNIQLENTQKWDRVLLHPIWGSLIFLFSMFLVFQSLFFISSFPMDWIDLGISNLVKYSQNNISIPWLNQFVSNALLPGLGGIVIFIPQIAILFFLIGLLEQIGYLSRISFLSDAFLRKFGLSGHSVVPLVSGWACAIPAIMSTRIIDNPRERLAVILASPLMTCSARLPVYTIIISVLIPEQSVWAWAKGLILLSLYLLGTFATLFVSFLASKYLKVPANSNWILELPVFRNPDWKSIGLNVYDKTMSFVVQAGKIIFVISILLWILSSFSPESETFLKEHQKITQNSEESVLLEYSYLGYAGKAIEPAIRPLGYDWKIGIALISSFAAREVFVGTISSIYSIGSEEDDTIVERLRKETNDDGTQVFGWATSISLLIFYVFAMQCMSTLAIVKKETGSWMYVIGQFALMLVMAYGFSFIAYQLLTSL
jgi:ferrous iron transport protein B